MNGLDALDRREGRRLFGLDPEGYDAARPGHPDRLYELLVERCGLRAGAAVLEIGPGTGQATRRLLELGAEPLVAVEPNAALARYLMSATDGRVAVVGSALEDADLPAASFDLATAASSFHWVDEAVGLGKLRQALRPGGWVGIWWTQFGDDERPDPFIGAVDHLFTDVPRSPSGKQEGRPSFALDAERRLAALSDAGYTELGHERIPWSFTWDTEGIRGLYSTFSPVIALDADRRHALLDSVAQIAASEFGGTVTKPLLTSLYTARTPS